MKVFRLSMMMFMALLISAGSAFAAEEAVPESAAEEAAPVDDADLLLDDAEYSYGTVSRISETELAVVEYDYDTGEDVTVDYSLDPKVELDGVASLKDIAAKDSVEVDYLVKDGKKVAIALYVEKPLAEAAAPQT